MSFNSHRPLLRFEVLEPRRMLSATLPGDYNLDGVVDAADFIVWRTTLQETVTVAGDGADGNGDGRIGPEDYGLWRANFGNTLPDPPPDLIAVSLNSTTLTVTGTERDDNVFLEQSADQITIRGVGGSWSAAAVTSIVVNLRGGNDRVSLDSQGNGGEQALDAPITVTSGSGTTTVHLVDGPDVLLSGAHTLLVASDGTVTLDPQRTNWFDTNIQDAALRALGHNLYLDGLIDRSDMLAIFTSVEDGGMVDATEFHDLQSIANNAPLFGTLNYVDKLSGYVVNGSTANSQYQGQPLGNLAAGSTASQLGDLVNKWFLGLDRPATPYSYALASGTLFVDGPSSTDIEQGNLDDCGFLAALAETALHNPSTINDMFVDNGDGTFVVRFYHSDVAEYVTVDSYLPNGGGTYAGLPHGELWVALAEKAYAQIGEMSWFSRPNTYAAIEYLLAYKTLEQITGRAADGFNGTTGTSDLSTFAAVYAAGQLICFTSDISPPSSGIVSNHVYALISYDNATKTIILFNPWGIGYGLTTLTWAEVQANFQYYDCTA